MSGTATTYANPSGWMFDYDLEAGSGLTLAKVSHANYRLAKDVRVTAIWVGTDDPSVAGSQQKKLRLHTPALPTGVSGLISTPLIVNSPPSPSGFAYHPAAFGIKMQFAANAVFGANSDTLVITQEYQFAPYGLDPPHEPGGILEAARFSPLVQFNVVSGTATQHIRYIRIDYRINYALDRLSATPPSSPSGFGVANQAGIFRDAEGAASLSFSGRPTIADIFAAAEKPLQYEVVAPGLRRGLPLINGKPTTWDNTHQWPLTNGPLPTTPGAFHCAHCHWRWGAVYGISNSSFPTGKAGPQFGGIGWTNGRGGPVIDPLIPDQNYTFAVTNITGFENPAADVSQQPFANQFINSPGLPINVSSGGNLVQWFSIEAFRPADSDPHTWRGTTFIHGMYFAHGTAPIVAQALSKMGVSGTLNAPLLKPKPQQVWERFAL